MKGLSEAVRGIEEFAVRLFAVGAAAPAVAAVSAVEQPGVNAVTDAGRQQFLSVSAVAYLDTGFRRTRKMGDVAIGRLEGGSTAAAGDEADTAGVVAVFEAVVGAAAAAAAAAAAVDGRD